MGAIRSRYKLRIKFGLFPSTNLNLAPRVENLRIRPIEKTQCARADVRIAPTFYNAAGLAISVFYKQTLPLTIRPHRTILELKGMYKIGDNS